MTALRDQEYNFNLENDATEIKSTVMPIASIVETTSKSVSAAELPKKRRWPMLSTGTRTAIQGRVVHGQLIIANY